MTKTWIRFPDSLLSNRNYARLEGARNKQGLTGLSRDLLQSKSISLPDFSSIEICVCQFLSKCIDCITQENNVIVFSSEHDYNILGNATWLGRQSVLSIKSRLQPINRKFTPIAILTAFTNCDNLILTYIYINICLM